MLDIFLIIIINNNEQIKQIDNKKRQYLQQLELHTDVNFSSHVTQRIHVLHFLLNSQLTIASHLAHRVSWQGF